MSDENPPRRRTRDAERTREEILTVATTVFTLGGYDATRVEDIARRTRTTKATIYYYFGSKDGLYLAVLKRAFARIRAAERALDVSDLPPEEAIRALAEATVQFHLDDAEFVRLVQLENVNQARFLHRVQAPSALGRSAVEVIDAILARGRDEGVFRSDVDATEVHMFISALSIFPVASGATFRELFERDLMSPEQHARLRAVAGESVVAWLRTGA